MLTINKYGVCTHAWIEYTPTQKTIIKQMGKMWLRSDWVQSTKMQTWKTDMQGMGNHILAILNYNTMNNKPFDLNQWRKTVDVVATLNPTIEAFEIWNEPNDPKYKLGYMDNSPEHYVTMLMEAYKIIRYRTKALVIAPSITSGGINFLKQIMNINALNYIDVVSMHLYYDTVSTNRIHLQEVKDLIYGKPVWVTEIGKPSAITRTEAYQNNFLRTNLNPISGLKANKIFWYEFQDNPSLPASAEGHFGLIRKDYTHKPSYYSFKAYLY